MPEKARVVAKVKITAMVIIADLKVEKSKKMYEVSICLFSWQSYNIRL